MQFYLTFVGGIFLKAGFGCVLIFYFAFGIFGQDPVAAPTPPPEDPIKISTEEVHLNVTAQSDAGKFIPTLTANDLLVVEEGDPQTITSIKKVPANVLLLLDMGSELNFVKRISATRLIA